MPPAKSSCVPGRSVRQLSCFGRASAQPLRFASLASMSSVTYPVWARIYKIIWYIRSSIAPSTSDGMPARFSVADRLHVSRTSTWMQTRSDWPVTLPKQVRCSPQIVPQWTACKDSEDAPDFQIHFTPTHYLKYPSRTAPADCFSLAVTDLHPRSRGRLQLASAAPSVPPRIDPGYLRHAEDTPRLLSAIETCRQIAKQASLSILIADEVLPGK